MDIDDLNTKAYLEELYRQTGGDTEQQLSMHDLGAAIGLDKAESSSLAEQLIVQGQVELKTLAGGISITPEGMDILGISAPAPHSIKSDLQLSPGPVANDTDRRTVQLLTEEIKNEIPGLGLDYDLLEEIVLDLKTIETHMLSPKPKIAVLREIFHSLQGALTTANAGKAADRLKAIFP
jgi:hypothetical protein